MARELVTIEMSATVPKAERIQLTFKAERHLLGPIKPGGINAAALVLAKEYLSKMRPNDYKKFKYVEADIREETVA